MDRRVWFITGTSTGFGALLTRSLLARQECVVATARRDDSFAQFDGCDPELLLTAQLDVCNREQIARAVERAKERFGRIDVLVNNAGYGYFSTFEEADPAEIRAMYETNVFGLIGVTQQVLPIMRRQRSGTIVNLSSIAGRIATARGSFYQSTKWAVEAMSESLYIETNSFGIRVFLIEPGSYETDFGPRSARNTFSPDGSEYLQLSRIWSKGRDAVFPVRQDPKEVIDAIIAAVDGDETFDRIPVGIDARAAIDFRERHGWRAAVEDVRKKYSPE